MNRIFITAFDMLFSMQLSPYPSDCNENKMKALISMYISKKNQPVFQHCVQLSLRTRTEESHAAT